MKLQGITLRVGDLRTWVSVEIQAAPGYTLFSGGEKQVRSFAQVKLALPQCRTIPFEVNVSHSELNLRQK